MIKLAIAAVCLLPMARPAFAQNADITGNWDVTITMTDGTVRSAGLVLKHDAGTIVGTLSRPQGDLSVEATVKEKAVTLGFTVPTQDGPLNILLTGTAEGSGASASSMSGPVDLGARGQGQWTAKRAGTPSSATPSSATPAASLDVSGSWAFTVETPAGSGTPTMTFKQDGEKLTGQYVGQLGEAPLSGTIKGAAIEFTIDVSVEGNALRIRYAGSADKASMKGTVKLGDIAEGTFTATKK
jgi:hypothetical protein